MCSVCFEDVEKLVSYHKEKMCQECKDEAYAQDSMREAEEEQALEAEFEEVDDELDLEEGDIWERTDWPVTRFEIVRWIKEEFWDVKAFRWNFSTKSWREDKGRLIADLDSNGKLVEGINGEFIRKHYHKLSKKKS